MRYYFNIKDGTTMHDDEGMEFDDISAVKEEAIRSSGDMLKELQGEHFWTGEGCCGYPTNQIAAVTPFLH